MKRIAKCTHSAGFGPAPPKDRETTKKRTKEKNMKTVKVRLSFREELLGSLPNDRDIYRSFIASKAPDAASIEDEVESVGIEGVVEKSITVFPRNANGEPFIYDYQIKGFFKDACAMLSRLAPKGGDGKKKACNESSKLKAYKKIIDGLIFVEPREIVISGAESIGLCQRPLRAQTAQGERVALAISESIPAGAHIEFDVICLDDDNAKAVREWLDYGTLRGLGQWRNSGKGRFSWEELEK